MKGAKVQPYLCVVCGDDNQDNFYKSPKSRCKTHRKDIVKERYYLKQNKRTKQQVSDDITNYMKEKL